MTSLEQAVLDLLRDCPNLEVAAIVSRLRNPGAEQIVERLAADGLICPCEDTWTAPVFWQVAQ